MTSNYTPIGLLRIFLIDLLGNTNIKAVLDVTRKEQYYSKEVLQIIVKNKLDHLFAIAKNKIEGITKKQLTINLFDNKEKLEEIYDKTILKKITLLIKKDKILEAVNTCALYYQDDYPNMELRDWFELVEKYHI